MTSNAPPAPSGRQALRDAAFKHSMAASHELAALECENMKLRERVESPSEIEPTRQPVGGEAGEATGVFGMPPEVCARLRTRKDNLSVEAAALIEAQAREIRNVKSDLHTQQLIANVETDRAIAVESERDELRRSVGAQARGWADAEMRAKFHAEQVKKCIDDYSELKVERDELRARLEAPCEGVDAAYFSAYHSDGNFNCNAVSIYYASDLYRRLQEAQNRERLSIAAHSAEYRRAEAAEQRCGELAEAFEAQASYTQAAEQRAAEAVHREREAIALLSRTLNHGLDETTERRVKAAGNLAQDITNWLGKVVVLVSGESTDAAVRDRSERGGNG